MNQQSTRAEQLKPTRNEPKEVAHFVGFQINALPKTDR